MPEEAVQVDIFVAAQLEIMQREGRTKLKAFHSGRRLAWK
jgi:hypothetical protein